MELVIQIVLGLLVLGVLVFAYLASKVWHWGHVLTGVLLFFLTVGFAFLAANVLKIRNQYLADERRALDQLELRLAETQALQLGTREGAVIGRLAGAEVRIPEGAEEIPGLLDLEHDLQLANRQQGRVWKNAARAAAPNPQSGRVQLAIENPKPLGLAPGTILYAFEQDARRSQLATSKTQYIGELRVVESADQTVTVEPVLSFDERQAQRYQRSQSPWILYDTMPLDRREVFANLKASELQKFLPPASVEPYVRDGQAVSAEGKFLKDSGGAVLSPDQAQWHIVGFDDEDQPLGPEDAAKAKRFEYRRPLYDYALVFTQLSKERAQIVADYAGVQQDTAKLEVSLASAKELEVQRLEEQRRLKFDLQKLSRDRQKIEAYAAELTKQVARAEELYGATLASSRDLVLQLSTTQRAMQAPLDPQPAGARPATDIDAL